MRVRNAPLIALFLLAFAASARPDAIVQSRGEVRYVTPRPWSEFAETWERMSGEGLRLVSIQATGGRWSGAYVPGHDAYFLWAGVAWPNFHAKWEELSRGGLRLTDLVVEDDGPAPRFTGVWREGHDAHDLRVGLTWDELTKLWQEHAAKGLRLIKCVAYREGGAMHFAGVWREGHDAYALYAAPADDFRAKWKQLRASGLHLIDQTLSGPLVIGVWRQGRDTDDAWLLQDGSIVASRNFPIASGALFLGNRFAPGCGPRCHGHIVMPTGSYEYPVGDDLYRWPVIVTKTSREPRESALQFREQIFTLPFSDRAVRGLGFWQYDNLEYHHAVDYARDDSKSFDVLAAAPGRVVLTSWDTWSGNTVVISHANDTFRTIYMHLRGGAARDCADAWKETMPTLDGDHAKEYRQHLLDTGCSRDPARRHPDPDQWGTNETILVKVGDVVTAGTPIAHAGNTGPGGKRGGGGPNTHLHVFFAHRDPTDGRWYFFDPYGIYADPTCYPDETTAAPDPSCATHPVAWKGGRPQYPN